jgi:membrane protein YqaA with SNARE-associated domain
MVRVRRSVDRWWFLPSMALLSAIDLFILVIPTEGLLVSAVLVRPRRWIAIALAGAAGSGFGAWLLAGAVKLWGMPFLTAYAPSALKSENWDRISAWVSHWGAWAMAGVSLSPLPQQPAVAICALTSITVTEIVAAVFLARAVKFGLFCWAARHAPKLLREIDDKGVREKAALDRVERELANNERELANNERAPDHRDGSR